MESTCGYVHKDKIDFEIKPYTHSNYVWICYCNDLGKAYGYTPNDWFLNCKYSLPQWYDKKEDKPSSYKKWEREERQRIENEYFLAKKL